MIHSGCGREIGSPGRVGKRLMADGRLSPLRRVALVRGTLRGTYNEPQQLSLSISLSPWLAVAVPTLTVCGLV